jgi:hypothetical protein
MDPDPHSNHHHHCLKAVNADGVVHSVDYVHPDRDLCPVVHCHRLTLVTVNRDLHLVEVTVGNLPDNHRPLIPREVSAAS